MKILLVSNRFAPVPGGTEAVLTHTRAALEAEGHRIAMFSIRSADSFVDGWSDYWPTENELARHPMRRSDSLATVYSPATRRRLERLIDAFRPDVAHLHNVYEKLTLSVVDALHGRGVPIVMTLHDYRSVCPNGILLTRDGPCRRCVGGGAYRHALHHRCLNGSFARTLVSVAESYVNRVQRRYEKISLFVAPTTTLRDIVVSGGLPSERVRVVRNPVPSDVGLRRELPQPPRFVYFGRLVEAKGLDVLLDASSQLRANGRVVIHGTGRMERRLADRIRRERLPAELAGYVPPAEVARRLRRSTAAVVPSLWVENSPMAFLEAAASGVASVASDVAAIRELAVNGEDSLLVPPGDPSALAAAMNELGDDPAAARRIGETAWRRVRDRHSPDRYLRDLIDAYDEARGA